jgi:subtilisin family serine protease
MKTYNVILHKGVDYQSFWDDMENENDGGNLYIPNRRVDSPNLRPASERQTWYSLTEEEVELIKQDTRVFAVEIPPEFRNDIEIVSFATQRGNFTKDTIDTGSNKNWGLMRCINSRNEDIYGTNDSASINEFTYTLTGRGVDIVIQDGGVEVDHPEYSDRYQFLDWSLYGGGAFTQSVNHERDWYGHGTHVAGIATGKTFGWAKEAHVYSQKILGLEGSSSFQGFDDSGTGISATYAFDAIKSWHNSKPIDPNTGYKRPTIVNMSWGYSQGYDFTNLAEINYRGVSYTDATSIEFSSNGFLYRKNNYGVVYDVTVPTSLNVRIPSVDTDIDELVDAGVHVTIAAGNSYFKVDLPGGPDFDNYIDDNISTRYYHRGTSPYGDSSFTGINHVIQVGNINSSPSFANLDVKKKSSECGPGVDIYAPGSEIYSACSVTNSLGDAPYFEDPNYRQSNIGGTSMAAPQVAGVLACILQIHPDWSPQKAKQWLIDNSTDQLDVYTNQDNDWSNLEGLKGGEPRILYQPFSNPTPLTISGSQSFNFDITLS